MPRKDPIARKAYSEQYSAKNRERRQNTYLKLCKEYSERKLPKSKAHGIINGIPYIADESGYIESVPHIDPLGRFINGKRLRHAISMHGYHKVVLSYNGLRFSGDVHALVKRAFHGRSVGSDVNHKNGVKTDNRLMNLEYVSRQYNKLHASWALGNYNPKLENQTKEKICKLWSVGLLSYKITNNA